MAVERYTLSKDATVDIDRGDTAAHTPELAAEITAFHALLVAHGEVQSGQGEKENDKREASKETPRRIPRIIYSHPGFVLETHYPEAPAPVNGAERFLLATVNAQILLQHLWTIGETRRQLAEYDPSRAHEPQIPEDGLEALKRGVEICNGLFSARMRGVERLLHRKKPSSRK